MDSSTLLLLASLVHVSLSVQPPFFTLQSKFPIYEDEDFLIDIHTRNATIAPYSVLIFRCVSIANGTNEIKLHPGFLKGLPAPRNEDLFSVKDYRIERSVVKAVLGFKRGSTGGTLEVILLETDSRRHRDGVLRDDRARSRFSLGSVAVSLMLHWRLELSQHTLDHRVGTLIHGSIGILKCTATGGFPFSPVTFIGTKSLDRQEKTSIDGQNGIQLVFQTRIEDHWREIGCMAGNDKIYDRLRVFHHPRQLEFIPKPSGYVRNGTSISCRAKDGYPTPEVKWLLESGPKNSDQYFAINKSELLINSNAPLKSKWNFTCLSQNSIPGSMTGGKTETISFIIGEAPFPWLMVNAIVIGCILGILILTCLAYRAHVVKKLTKKKQMIKNKPIFLGYKKINKTDSIHSLMTQEPVYPVHLV